MSSAKSTRRQEQAERATARKRSNLLFGAVVAGIAIVFIAAIALTRTATEEPGSAAPSDTKPESTSGSESVLGVASDTSLIELGHVPLNKTVEPTWTLTNTSDRAVRLGEAHAEVLEGCCPGPLEFTSTALKPGDKAQLVFPLQMHEGMDGPHDFDVHVPISSGGKEELMTLKVTGDFSA